MSIDNETTVDGREPASTIGRILVTIGLIVGVVTVGLIVCVVAIAARAYVQALTGTDRPPRDVASINTGQGAHVSGEREGGRREDVRSRLGSLESRYSSLITHRFEEPLTYAEGILNVCRRDVEAPFACVSGMSGANRKQRIDEIMTNWIVQTLNLGRKMLLAGVGMVAVAGPTALGIGTRQVRAQTPQSPPAFDVVSVRPYKSLNPGRGGDLRDPTFLAGGRFTSRAPLIMVIAAAYDVPFFGSAARISGGPAWINSLDLVYEIEAVPVKDAAPDGLSASAQANKRRQMLQALLADRFKLVVRHETKELPVYVLTVGKDGPKLPKADIQEKDCPEASPANTPADGNVVCHRFNGGRGRGLHARAVDMADLVNVLQGWTDLPLFEETGLKGLYHIETEPWLPMELGSSRTNVDGADVANLPTLFTVFERLGLKMVAQKRNVDRYVIDHVEKPTEN